MMAPDAQKPLQVLGVEVIVLGQEDAQRHRSLDRCRGQFQQWQCLGIGPAHHPVYRLKQFTLLDGFEQIGADVQFPTAGQVAGAVPRGQQDDAAGGQLGPLPDDSGQRQARGVSRTNSVIPRMAFMGVRIS
jgi:hypothetical protein